MARDDLHFRLRIPEELKHRIEAAAKENRRSMTAEIIDRLDRSFQFEDVPGIDEATRIVTKETVILQFMQDTLRKMADDESPSVRRFAEQLLSVPKQQVTSEPMSPAAVESGRKVMRRIIREHQEGLHAQIPLQPLSQEPSTNVPYPIGMPWADVFKEGKKAK